MKTAAMILSITYVLILAGCETSAQTGGIFGAGTGAVLGEILFDEPVAGAAIGGGLGYMAGNEMDKQNAESVSQYRYSKAIAEARTSVVQVHNSNGSVTPVELNRRSDGSWTGPRGEIYSNMPTERQLSMAYGF